MPVLVRVFRSPGLHKKQFCFTFTQYHSPRNLQDQFEKSSSVTNFRYFCLFVTHTATNALSQAISGTGSFLISHNGRDEYLKKIVCITLKKVEKPSTIHVYQLYKSKQQTDPKTNQTLRVFMTIAFKQFFSLFAVAIIKVRLPNNY